MMLMFMKWKCNYASLTPGVLQARALVTPRPRPSAPRLCCGLHRAIASHPGPALLAAAACSAAVLRPEPDSAPL